MGFVRVLQQSVITSPVSITWLFFIVVTKCGTWAGAPHPRGVLSCSPLGSATHGFLSFLQHCCHIYKQHCCHIYMFSGTRCYGAGQEVPQNFQKQYSASKRRTLVTYWCIIIFQTWNFKKKCVLCNTEINF